MARPKQFWFNTALIFGCIVALLLVVQSIFVYVYISRRIEVDQISHDSDRIAARLERDSRQPAGSNPVSIAALMGTIRTDEAARQEPVAWLRLFDSEGHILAESGTPIGPVPGAKVIRRLLADRFPVHRIEQAPAGKVFVNVLPVHLQIHSPASAPGQQSRFGPRLLEIGIYQSSVARGYNILRLNLLISSAAALMLLGSMLLIAYRIKAYLQGQQLEQQFAIARSVQHHLLPLSASSSKELECAGVCIPVWQVGGDFYDVFIAPAGNTALVVGDVAGKGVGAALVMSLLHGAIRCSSWIGKSAHEAATRSINSVLISSTNQNTFATLFWAYYQAPMLHYINAGHCRPLLLRKNLHRFSIEHLCEGGPVVGLLPEATYAQGTVTLEPGDLLVLPTDGVLEAEDPSGEQYGEERLRALIEAHASLSCAQIRDHIVDSVHAFAQTKLLQDDLTVMIVRVPVQ